MVLLVCVGLFFGERVALDAIDAALDKAGLRGQVTLAWYPTPTIRLDEVATRRPLVAEGISLELAVDQVTVAVDPWGGLRHGVWLAEAVAVDAPRISLTKAARVARPAKGGAASGDRLGKWLPRLSDLLMGY